MRRPALHAVPLPANTTRWFFALGALGTAVIAAQLLADPARREALNTAARLWMERAHRVPVVVLETPQRSLAIEGGGTLAPLPLTLEVAEERALPTKSPVVAVAEAGDALYLGTFADGVWRLKSGAAPVQLSVDASVNELAVSPEGTLYVASLGGAWRIGSDGAVTRLAKGPYTSVALWRGKAWFASAHGLAVEDGDGLWTRGEAQGVAMDHPDALADCGDELCVGAVDGLWRFDGARATHAVSPELGAEWVTAVSFAGGQTFAGTVDGGLVRLGEKPRRYAKSDGLADAHVNPHSVAVLGETIFVGTPTGLVALKDGAAASFALDLGEGALPVVAAARDGGLWVTSLSGVQRLVPTEVAP